jgi:hypothetical protein
LRQEDFEETVLSAAQPLDMLSRLGITAIIENPDSGFDPTELPQQGGKASLEKIPSIPNWVADRERICLLSIHTSASSNLPRLPSAWPTNRWFLIIHRTGQQAWVDPTLTRTAICAEYRLYRTDAIPLSFPGFRSPQGRADRSAPGLSLH